MMEGYLSLTLAEQKFTAEVRSEWSRAQTKGLSQVKEDTIRTKIEAKLSKTLCGKIFDFTNLGHSDWIDSVQFGMIQNAQIVERIRFNGH